MKSFKASTLFSFKGYMILFACAIFSNFALIPNILLADIIYGLFACTFFISQLRIKIPVYYYRIYAIPILFFLIAFINLLLYNKLEAFGSQMRYIFNLSIFIIIVVGILSREREQQKNFIFAYEAVCAFFASFVIIQFISFYLIGINIPFNFGSFSAETNAASTYDPLDIILYRTGGFFKEPSWFAVFMAPILDISYRQKHIKIFIICLLGMILSTSNLAFLLIFIFLIFRLKNVKIIFLTLILGGLVYYIFPIVFERLFDSLTLGDIGKASSTNVRVYDPFSLTFNIDNSSLLGLDITKISDGFIFLNTFLFTYFSFGLLGLLIILFLMKDSSSCVLFLSLVVVIIVEGCYGRMDFWMAFVACYVFNKYISSLKRDESTIY